MRKKVRVTEKQFKCASFFAGVGGIDLGFQRNGFQIIYANEIDEYPVITYELNHGLKVDCRDICVVAEEAQNIPDFEILLAGFPCQAFSIAGYRQGFDDEKGRGTLFFELIKIIREKKPEVVFLENVKNLATHNNGDTLRTILNALREEGYAEPHAKVLNAMDYGNIPQNRERIYIVAFRDKVVSDRFSFPISVPLTRKLSDIIDFHAKVDDKYTYARGKYKSEMIDKIMESVTSQETVYQWRRQYVRENKSGVIPTLTANMGTGGHNVPLILSDYGVRKLTPHECFNAQGFPENFKLPDNVAESRLYKQAGNSVCVSVIERIAEQIKKALEET